jgi:hypothetical protein
MWGILQIGIYPNIVIALGFYCMVDNFNSDVI